MNEPVNYSRLLAGCGILIVLLLTGLLMLGLQIALLNPSPADVMQKIDLHHRITMEKLTDLQAQIQQHDKPMERSK